MTRAWPRSGRTRRRCWPAISACWAPTLRSPSRLNWSRRSAYWPSVTGRLFRSVGEGHFQQIEDRLRGVGRASTGSDSTRRAWRPRGGRAHVGDVVVADHEDAVGREFQLVAR